MAIKTQGTQIYAIDPDTGAVIEVDCAISADGLDTTLEQIETTCLSSPVRTYESGLATPGTATVQINFDPKETSHVRLHQLKQQGAVLSWAIGFSDGTDTPTASANSSGEYEFTLPTTRSWVEFEGFMNSFPFSFSQNAVVTTTIGIQVSGEVAVYPKS